MTSIRGTNDGGWGIGMNGSELVRVPPEPRTGNGQWVRTAIDTLSSVGGAVARAGGSVLGGSVLGGASSVGADFEGLLQSQIEVQKVMATVSMHSNIEKSRHETEMAPIRNLRVG